MYEKLLKIAMKHFPAVEDRKSLATRDNDHEDFFEVSIWSLKAALEEAYKAGLKEGEKHETRNKGNAIEHCRKSRKR